MVDHASADGHINAARARLVHLSGLAEKTAATEERIRDAAMARRSAIETELSALRPLVHLDAGAADRHQELTLERGRIDTVIATADRHLPSATS